MRARRRTLVTPASRHTRQGPAGEFLALLVFAAVLTMSGTPAPATAQDTGRCDALCFADPLQIPEECRSFCSVTAAESGPLGSGSFGEVIEAMMRDQAARAEGVENYYVVEISNIAPFPALHYYEKEMVDGRPRFRLVPPDELAQREAVTDPDSDIPPEAAQNPAGLLGSLGDALGAAAGVLGGEGAAGAATAEVLDIFAGGFQQAGVDVAAAQADRMANPAFGDEALEMLRPHADRFVPTSLGWYYPDRPDPAARFEPLESYCLAGSDPIPGCVDDETRRNLIDNYTLAGERPDGALLGAIFRMKPGETFEYSTPDGSTMRVTDAEYWLAYNSFEPILVYFEGTTASADGPQPITVSRETDRYADVHTLRLPHRTRLRLGGAFDLAALTAAAGRSLQEIATEVVRAKANPGPLSSSEIRDILAEVLQDPEIAARLGN